MLNGKTRSASEVAPRPSSLAIALARLEGMGLKLRSRYSWTLRPLAAGAAIRLLVFAAGVAGSRLVGSVKFGGMLRIWLQKDAIWYVDIAKEGYFYTNGVALSANFFPLYPLTIGIVQHFTRLFVKGDSYLAAGMAISWVAFLVSCVLLFWMVSNRFGEQTAYLSVLLLGLFPFSLFYGAAYTESLYLVCALLAFLGIESGNWWLAGTAALLAGATRPTGLILGLAVVVAYLLDWFRTRHRLRCDLLSLALVPLGVAAYAGYCWLRFGDPLTYLKVSAEHWGGHLQLSSIEAAATLLSHPHEWLQTSATLLDFIYVLLVLAFLILCYPIYRLLGASYLVYSFLTCVAPILDFPGLKSTGRYLSVIFPAFIVVAYALRERPILRDAAIIGFSLLLAVAVTSFTSNYGVY